ncbi:ATP-binding protein [Myxococcota bacterium]|nr:ATP-binding protein [Myxococcota bacterium]MBU1898192.1 ATP-binding protein [Myxococcota bacterium]
MRSTDVDLPRAADLPQWTQQLKDRYLKTNTGQFILHGNVHDLIFSGGRAWALPEFLSAFFRPSDKLVVHYDPGRGISFPDDASAARAGRALAREGMLSRAKLLPKGDDTPDLIVARRVEAEIAGERAPEVALEIIEALLAAPRLPVALIIHYAELIAPDGPPSSLSFYDRTAGARLHRWSMAHEIVKGDNLVLMLTSALPDLSRRLSRNPQVLALRVPLPDPMTRARFIASLHAGLDPERGAELTRITAGLQLRQIQEILAVKATGGLTFDKAQAPIEAISARKKEILEQECAGLIEVIEPTHGFEHVGGHEHIKAALTRIAAHIKAGRTRQVPMGVLFVGPMGTGKSFLGEAFARSSGLACIRLKNFRDKWVGSTEANLEKVLDVIEGLGQILVLIDEGDRAMGGGDSDGGVNSRVMARLKEFMSDPTHRGRIIFVMMTNRPDKLDVDMKRPGRFDLKIPFFPPKDAAERAQIVHAVMRRHEIPHALTDEALLAQLEPLEGYAAADLEALTLLAYDDLESAGGAALTAAHIEAAARDFMPTRDVEMMRYMELLAVHETSNRRLLPPRFKDIEVAALNEALSEARRRLQGRAAHALV